MKNLIPTKYLPWLTLAVGCLGLLLRWLLYTLGVDDRGLLEEGHILQFLLWLLAAVWTAVLALSAFRLDGSNLYDDNFFPSVPGGAGCFLGAVGIVYTVVTGRGEFPDGLTNARMYLGVAAGASLIAIGVCRLSGKKPFFLLYGLVCAFFALNLANLYRVWSGDPQTENYAFSLFACIALMLAAYYHAGFCADSGQRRTQIFTGLMAALLCCLALGHTDTPLFYLGCGIWSLTNLCPMTPPRRRRRRTSDAVAGPETDN